MRVILNFAFKILLICTVLNFAMFADAQTADSTKVIRHFWGAVTLSTKGLSTFPNLTLGNLPSFLTCRWGEKNSGSSPSFVLRSKENRGRSFSGAVTNCWTMRNFSLKLARILHIHLKQLLSLMPEQPKKFWGYNNTLQVNCHPFLKLVKTSVLGLIIFMPRDWKKTSFKTATSFPSGRISPVLNSPINTSWN